MKSLFKHIITTAITGILFCMLFTACNKEDLKARKVMQVVINGYNGSDHAWQVSIDTTNYDIATAYGKFIIKPAEMIGFNAVYTSPLHQQATPTLTLTDTSTKAVIFSQPLPGSGTKAAFNFIYFDGKALEINPPAAEAATNKLGFYVRHTDGDALFDIFLYRKDATEGTEYRTYIAKNVKPNTWVYADYLSSPDFDTKNELDGAFIYFTKAGTTDQWALGDSEDNSSISAFGMNLPLAGEKGLVQPYFLAHGQFRLEMTRLYFYPDRTW
ncbi:hypothetical protein [Chitinophaga varians]|uniref:hypothetical protein n=1 Tax=Chitinophaga varians TaxID=2202339 RepID=UPI00165F34BB|nr:hypothetical protein [Chitinophaga varians]MBC9913920.1 hypothetical protein [Chitinophaga varians]